MYVLLEDMRALPFIFFFKGGNYKDENNETY